MRAGSKRRYPSPSPLPIRCPTSRRARVDRCAGPAANPRSKAPGRVMRKLASFPRCRADLAATRNSEEIIEKIRIFILDAPLHPFRIIHYLGGFAMSKRHILAGLVAAAVQAAPAFAQ